MAPQGFLASDDGYARRFDEVIADITRKTKCVDDTAMWGTELEEHWWRMIDFLIFLGNNGIILNEEKFQFAKREVNFAGFHITEDGVKPLEKFLIAIRDFPTPARISDIISWLGLVHQVAHYNKLVCIMSPFKHPLSSQAKFAWTNELDDAFKKSKDEIIQAIEKGVKIFDINRGTV